MNNPTQATTPSRPAGKPTSPTASSQARWIGRTRRSTRRRPCGKPGQFALPPGLLCSGRGGERRHLRGPAGGHQYRDLAFAYGDYGG
jgi:hypothetical protein